MKVLIFAGSSGGHLFPAMVFSDAFLARHPESEIAYVVSEGLSTQFRNRLVEAYEHVYFLPKFPYPDKFLWQGLPFIVNVLRALLKSRKILKEVEPDLLVSFGTYVSIPAVLLAGKRNLPILIHEQNVVLGKANEFAVRWATKVAVSFPETLGFLPLGKGVLTGNPLRFELMQFAMRPRREDLHRFHLLALGGSQGARRLNQALLKALELLSPEEKSRIVVTHITGHSQGDTVRQAYESLRIEHLVLPYSDEMGVFYADADLVIGRAGAGTVSEIAYFGIPSILIPYPYARSHQLMNAKYVANKMAAVLIEEKDLKPEVLKEQILSLIRNHSYYLQMQGRVRALAQPNATSDLVRVAEDLLDVPREMMGSEEEEGVREPVEKL